MSIPDHITLDGGDRMPRIGYGTWLASEHDVEKGVSLALEAGYRHFDTAPVYENERGVGRALKRWINNDPAKRKELFVVTKLPPAGNRPDLVDHFFTASLEDLGLEYIDMYLIHAPFAFEYIPGDLMPKNSDGCLKLDCSTDLVAVWKEVLKLKESGRVRHVGVSNMNEEQVKRFATVYKPECLQIEINVTCQQKELMAAVLRMGIPLVAYSPLGSKTIADELSQTSGRDYPKPLELHSVKNIAQAHLRTPAQILLRFLLQRGVCAIPKSTNPARIKENICVWDFELSNSEMNELSSLDRGDNGRVCDFTFLAGVERHPEFPFKRY